MFQSDGAVYVRLFNASGEDTPQELGIGFEARSIELVELDGRIIEQLRPKVVDGGKRTISLSMPRYGIRTLRFSTLRTPGQ
jgi:alpha-mannosidase